MAIAVKHKTVMEYLPQVKTMVLLLSLAVKWPLVTLGGDISEGFLVIVISEVKLFLSLGQICQLF